MRAARVRRARTDTIVKLGAARQPLAAAERFDVTVCRTACARVVDTTGAGDAFNGGFLAGLARGAAAARVPAPRQLRRRAVDDEPRPGPSTHLPTGPRDHGRPGDHGLAAMKIAVDRRRGRPNAAARGGLTRSDLPIEQIALYDVDQDRLSAIGARRRADGGAKVASCSARRSTMRDGRRLRLHQHPRRRHRRTRSATRPSRCRTASSVRRRSVRRGSRWRCAPSRRWCEYAREIAARRAGRLDHQLHEPGRHGHGGDAHGHRPGHRHLRHADRAVRRGGARARSAQRPCFFDYFGLNHLGWMREVYCDGEPQLRRLWNDRERAAVALQGAAVRSGVPARARAAADRVRLLLRPAARGASTTCGGRDRAAAR